MVNLLSRAVRLLPRAGPDRVELLAELGEALYELGEFASADAALEEAIEKALGLSTIAGSRAMRRSRACGRAGRPNPKEWRSALGRKRSD